MNNIVMLYKDEDDNLVEDTLVFKFIGIKYY